MTFEGTIYLDFDCVSHDYHIDSDQCPGLVRYVLEQDAALADFLFCALDRVYPGKPWSSPGNSKFRRLCGWVLQRQDPPALQRSPERQRILEQLQRVRDCMTDACASRSFERHYYSDFPLAARLWKERRYQVISFSTSRSEQHQSRILELAAPDGEVVSVALRRNSSATYLDRLSSRFPRESNRCFLIFEAGNLPLAAEWRRKRIRTVLVDRKWRQKAHLERRCGLYLGLLSDFDPVYESKREYY